MGRKAECILVPEDLVKLIVARVSITLGLPPEPLLGCGRRIIPRGFQSRCISKLGIHVHIEYEFLGVV